MPLSFIATSQNPLGEVGPISLTSGQAYDAAVITATAPSTTGQSALVVSPTNDCPSLLRITPYAGGSTYTNVGLRVVGWNTYIEASGANIGRRLFIPTVLADLTLGYTSGTVPSLSIEGATANFFSSVTAATGVPTVNVYSPATAASTNVQHAHAVVDIIGSQFVTLQFRATGTSPTMGAFWATI